MTTNNITVEWSQPVYPNGIVDSFVIVITDDISHAEVDHVMTSGNASNHLATFSGLLSVWPYTIHVAAYTNSLGNSSTITATTYGGTDVHMYVCAQQIFCILYFVTLHTYWYYSKLSSGYVFRVVIRCCLQL